MYLAFLLLLIHIKYIANQLHLIYRKEDQPRVAVATSQYTSQELLEECGEPTKVISILFTTILSSSPFYSIHPMDKLYSPFYILSLPHSILSCSILQSMINAISKQPV